MATIIDQLKTEAGTLSEPERAELAFFLLTSLEPHEDHAKQDWQDEIARRVIEIRTGQTCGNDSDEVLAQLRGHHP